MYNEAMKKLFFLLILLYLFITPVTQAHPGNTASDGCHYCRTNCDKWGVAWGERHCHGDRSIPVQQPVEPMYEAPTNTLPPERIYPTWTPKPTRKPLPTRAPIPTRTPTPPIIMTFAPTATPSPTMKVIRKANRVITPTPTPWRWWNWIFEL